LRKEEPIIVVVGGGGGGGLTAENVEERLISYSPDDGDDGSGVRD
jgi:hypothetical protein